MAIADELSIRTAIVEKIKTVAGSGKVYPCYLRALDGQESTFNETFLDGNGRINTQMVRRVQCIPVVDKYNRPVSDTHVYTIAISYGIGEEVNSEGTVQLMVESIRAAFKNDLHLGLDGVTHRQIRLDRFADSELASRKVHSPELSLIVDAEDC